MLQKSFLCFAWFTSWLIFCVFPHIKLCFWGELPRSLIEQFFAEGSGKSLNSLKLSFSPFFGFISCSDMSGNITAMHMWQFIHTTKLKHPQEWFYLLCEKTLQSLQSPLHLCVLFIKKQGIFIFLCLRRLFKVWYTIQNRKKLLASVAFTLRQRIWGEITILLAPAAHPEPQQVWSSPGIPDQLSSSRTPEQGGAAAPHRAELSVTQKENCRLQNHWKVGKIKTGILAVLHTVRSFQICNSWAQGRAQALTSLCHNNPIYSMGCPVL